MYGFYNVNMNSCVVLVQVAEAYRREWSNEGQVGVLDATGKEKDPCLQQAALEVTWKGQRERE